LAGHGVADGELAVDVRGEVGPPEHRDAAAGRLREVEGAHDALDAGKRVLLGVEEGHHYIPGKGTFNIQHRTSNRVKR